MESVCRCSCCPRMTRTPSSCAARRIPRRSSPPRARRSRSAARGSPAAAHAARPLVPLPCFTVSSPVPYGHIYAPARGIMPGNRWRKTGGTSMARCGCAACLARRCTGDSRWVSIQWHAPIASVAALTAQPLAALPPYGCGVPLAGCERLVQGNSTAEVLWCTTAPP